MEKRNQAYAVWLRVGALAACVCLLITGVFGGLHLFGGENPSAITEQGTPNLPLDQYPPDEVDYANMSMVEYMELFPDFLSYRYMPWYEGYAFAHLEILEKKVGYKKVEEWVEGSGYQKNQDSASYQYIAYKCRVIEDAWNMFEPGAEIHIFVSDYRTRSYLDGLDSVLLRMRTGKLGGYENVSGDRFYAEAEAFSLGLLGFFPVKDGKVQTQNLDFYLKINKLRLNYDGNPVYSCDPNYIYCKFSDVKSIAGDGMPVETAIANLQDVYERYQTGEYNYLSADLVSQMNYGEYCRVTEGTVTDEDIDKFGFRLAIEYASMSPLVFTELSLSDGTKFEFCTRAEISEKWMKKLVEEDIPSIELAHTDENGKLNAEACVEEIKKKEFGYCWMSLYGIEPELFDS